jgi:DNA-binding NtrC family response regulator
VVKLTQSVLVVLKDRKECEAIKHCLESFGCAVDVATEGLEAMNFLWKNCPYHLLITEVIVDEISGLALHTLAIRMSPFIITIALNKGGSVLRGVVEKFGIDQVVDLPINVQRLCSIARDMLDGNGQ